MLPVIPLASVSTIALMALFARSNYKQGWVKNRRPLVEKLRDLKRDLSTVPPEVADHSSAIYAGMAVNPVEFSQQLGSLQVSLQRANASAAAQPLAPGRVTEPETVSVRS